MISCCMNCTERRQGCHSLCARYKEFREKREAIRASRAKEREYTDFTFHKKVRIKKHENR